MFIVIEIQKTTDACGTIATAYESEATAQQAFHTAAAAAAVSQVKVHSVLMVNEYGDELRPAESYSH